MTSCNYSSYASHCQYQREVALAWSINTI